jgi:hypothetical protein
MDSVTTRFGSGVICTGRKVSRTVIDSVTDVVAGDARPMSEGRACASFDLFDAERPDNTFDAALGFLARSARWYLRETMFCCTKQLKSGVH